MGWLRFQIARLLGKDTVLARSATPQADLFAELRGKQVALVGNARSLGLTAFGPAIAGADIVIRLNAAPMPAAASHGTRTDWIALSTPIPPATLAERAPNRVLWMTPKRKRLPHALATRSGFYLHPAPDHAALSATLHSRPTTGLMMIDLLARSPASRIDLFGFDFFASQSLSGGRTAAQVPHDFATERGFVEALVARDPRFCLNTPPRAA